MESDFLTDQFRAEAQAGGVISGLGDLLQRLQEMGQRTEGNNRDVAVSTRQNKLMIDKYGNEKWLNSHVGEGLVMESVVNPLTGQEELHDTGIPKIPYSLLAQKWQDENNEIIQDEYGKFKVSSEQFKNAWMTQAKLNQNQQALHINNIQVQLAQQAAEDSVVRKVEQAMEQATVGGDLQSIQKYAEGVLNNAVAVGDISESKALSLRTGMFGSFRQIIKDREKALQEAQDENYVQSLIKDVDDKKKTEEQVIGEINRNKVFGGDSQRINGSIARFHTLIALKNDAKRKRAEEIESANMDFLRKRDPQGMIDFINSLPQNELTLFPVDERLSQAYSLAANLAKPTPIESNKSVRSWFNNYALDVAMGRIDKPGLNEALRAARYGIDIEKDGKKVHVYRVGTPGKYTDRDTPWIDDSDFTTIDERATSDLAAAQLNVLGDKEKFLLNMFLATTGGTDINAANIIIFSMDEAKRKDALAMRALAYDYQNDFSNQAMKQLRENRDIAPDKLTTMMDELAGRYITAFNNKVASGDLEIPAEIKLPATEAEISAAWLKTLQERWPNLPQPKTEEEYNRLPSGAEYIHTDGTKRRKK